MKRLLFRLSALTLLLAIPALSAEAEPGSSSPPGSTAVEGEAPVRSGLQASYAPGKAAALSGSRGAVKPEAGDRIALDLVFVVDTTSSMGRVLSTLKKAISAIAAETAALRPAVSLRLGLLLFRDRGDDYAASILPLAPDFTAFRSSLEGAAARGGGDQAEDIGAALSAAAEGLVWKEGALHLVFLFTDAAPRKALPNEKTSYSGAIAAARDLGLVVYTVGAEAIPPAGETALCDIAASTGAVYLPLGGPRRGKADAEPNLVRGSLEDLVLGFIEDELAAARETVSEGRRQAVARLLGQAEAGIRERITYPELARRRGIEGTVRVLLKVGTAGEALSVSLASSSGERLLDRAALELAASIFPLDNETGRVTELEIAIRYRLQ